MQSSVSAPQSQPAQTPSKLVPKLSVVDDDEDFLQLLRDMESASGAFHVVDTFLNAAQALKGVQKRPPDLVLVDLNLPGLSGVQCVRALRIALPALPVLVCTGQPDSPGFLRSIVAGARGLLVKPFGIPELSAAIEGVLRDGFYFAKPAIPYVVQVIRHVCALPCGEGLSEREEEVLACLLLGLEQKEIASKLGIGESTVHTYVQRLHSRLGVHSTKEIIAKYFDPC